MTISKKKNLKVLLNTIMLVVIALTAFKFVQSNPPALKITKGDHIILIGNNLGSRMMNYGHFETEMQLRYPDSMLYIRNMCDGGDTPGFRAHSGRVLPWAFPGAEKFQTELARNSNSEGHYDSPDTWITNHKADIIIAFFGYNESFQGPMGLENYKAELEDFIIHTLKQKYNGKTSPQLALVSPIAFEDLSGQFDLPNGKTENKNLELYSLAMKEVAAKHKVHYLDVFTTIKQWYAANEKPMTIDGSQLTEAAYAKFAPLLADGIFGKTKIKPSAESNRKLVHAAVQEKNWMWHNDIKIPNGVHVFGRRYNPFGQDNYPAELKKIREMTVIRDQAIWLALKGEKMDLGAADKITTALPKIQTNFNAEKNGSLK
ncbi:MAG: SGNH/GDSL hydrolase family protein, partial [Ignavibacteria bacterium]|nr:SGNH/GDSL hydrolase family protein [Ignavibacteria bacterium]